jgi:hypothetical protein
MREIVTYDDHVMAVMRRVDEVVVPIEDVKAFVPTTAEGRHEELTWNPPAFVPVYARRFVKAQEQSPVATNGWDNSRSH